MTRKRLLALALSVVSVVIFGPAKAAGKVSDGIYSSPLNNYTVPVPKWKGLKIQENNDNDFAIVSFLDRGTMPAPLQSIATLRLEPDVQTMLADVEKRDLLLSRFLTGFVLTGLFRNMADQTTLSHETFFDSNDRKLLFAVATIPEAHTFLHDPKKRKQADSLSGLLIFSNKGFMYMVRVEMKTLFDANLTPSSLDETKLKSTREALLRIMESMKFTD